MTLDELGWTPEFQEHLMALDLPDLVPARVVRQDPYSYFAMTGEATVMAELSGRFRPGGAEDQDRPAVGDWIALMPHGPDETALIHALLQRLPPFWVTSK